MKTLIEILSTLFEVYKWLCLFIISAILFGMALFGGEFSIQINTKWFVEKVKALEPFALVSIFFASAIILFFVICYLHFNQIENFNKKHNL